VILNIGNTDAAFMEIEENGIVSQKERFSSKKEFLLSNTDGKKTVTVKLYDETGSEATDVADWLS